MTNKIFRAKVFESEDAFNTFLANAKKIDPLCKEVNNGKIALFYEELPFVNAYTYYEDVGYEDLDAKNYEEWNNRMFGMRKPFDIQRMLDYNYD